jgi:hypothetical protein
MGPLPAFLLAAAALAAPAKDRPTPPDPKKVAELVRTVAAPRTADADRRAAEDELKRLDPVPVLPVIVAELERAGPGATLPGLGPGAANGGGLALVRLWNHYMFSEAEIEWVPATPGDGWFRKAPRVADKRTPQKKEAIGRALTDLLKGDRTDETRRLILHGLRRNYAPAAEAPLAAILEKGGPDQVTAAEILLERHHKAYAAAVIDRVADPDRPAA